MAGPQEGHGRVTAGSPSRHVIPTAARPVGTVPGCVSAVRTAHLSVPDHTPRAATQPDSRCPAISRDADSKVFLLQD